MTATSGTEAVTGLSLPEARRVAVAAAGLNPPLAEATPAAVLDRLRIVQLDSINVLARAHQLTLAARLPHATFAGIDAALDQASPPLAFEYPAHAHALVPLGDWPLWAFRRRASRARPEYPPPAERERILHLVRSRGPLTHRDLRPEGEQPSTGWSWGPVKRAVEFMLWAGDLICVRRTPTWQRLLDLPERHLATALHTNRLTDEECLTALLTHAARALGIATTADLADYLRISTRTTAALLPHTPLLPATVEGWTEPAWAHPDALTPPAPADDPPVFLGPFDNLIFNRPRTQRLFGFTHTLEAYKPAAKREHGYYVCPLLHHDQLIARADLTRTTHAVTITQTSTETNAPGNASALIHEALQHLTHAAQ
ncbi:DNA glycosylase AlkZ-like family protein [Streptomyces sp. Tu6071]|uniref:DNA glycosylase AlkZ-like family protein n=1 Tax=Streptomyces sp. Tu6071 TaxID=355249 RepID=UPI0003120131|nr:crosslink repair DNA glycosylase YcaQ family protein [Streptomyces sp. Tu6071]